MHQTGFSSAAVVPQSKSAELYSSAAVVPQVNLPRCEARRRHLIMTCDIFGSAQTNTLTLCYLLVIVDATAASALYIVGR